MNQQFIFLALNVGMLLFGDVNAAENQETPFVV
jgi:hypothetical protein